MVLFYILICKIKCKLISNRESKTFLCSETWRSRSLKKYRRASGHSLYLYLSCKLVSLAVNNKSTRQLFFWYNWPVTPFINTTAIGWCHVIFLFIVYMCLHLVAWITLSLILFLTFSLCRSFSDTRQNVFCTEFSQRHHRCCEVSKQNFFFLADCFHIAFSLCAKLG